MPTILKDYSDISPEMIQRYNRTGPRYTSYPTVPVWEQGADYGKEYTAFLEQEGQKQEPLSMYVHLPFCSRLCTFCGCNHYITTNSHYVEQYLKALETEIQYVAQALGSQKTIQQFHLGGGTPTHLNVAQLEQLLTLIQKYFILDLSGELALEAHPRVTTTEHLECLYAFGFRRLSLGVQDLDVQVQKAINRNQTLEQTQKTFYAARELGYDSINIDLVYGLPCQTQQIFRKTMEAVNDMRPDRLAIYNFAYIPNMFRSHERAIHEEDLPTPEEKIAIYIDTIRYFTTIGYEMIGMDHYAEPDDELTLALKNHTLHRNFMGYTTHQGLSQIGIGVSAISDFGNGYFQNEKDLFRYMEELTNKKFCKIRQKILDHDDLMRREIIENLMCHYQLLIPALEERYQVSFAAYFAKEWQQMELFAQEGLVELTHDKIQLTKLGVIFMRNIAMPFDRYLQEGSRDFNFSKTV